MEVQVTDSIPKMLEFAIVCARWIVFYNTFCVFSSLTLSAKNGISQHHRILWIISARIIGKWTTNGAQQLDVQPEPDSHSVNVYFKCSKGLISH